MKIPNKMMNFDEDYVAEKSIMCVYIYLYNYKT